MKGQEGRPELDNYQTACNGNGPKVIPFIMYILEEW